MKMWFLVVTLIDPQLGAKVAPFATEQECRKAMQTTVKELKGSKVVQKIECLEGEMGDEEGDQPSSDQESSKKKQYL